MPDVDGWLGEAFPLGDWLDGEPAADVARIIADRPVSIAIARGGTPLDPQTVRLEPLSTPRQQQGEGSVTVLADAVVIGAVGTDLQAGDRFKAGGVAYEIIGLVPGLAGSVQAYARVRT